MRTEAGVKDLVNTLLSIPFLPPEDTEMVFDRIYDTIPLVAGEYAPQVTKLWDYIDRVYLRGGGARCYEALRRQRRRRRRPIVPPRYPIWIWNVYSAVLNRVARTNNVVESWHNKLQLYIHAKTTFWKFIDNLRRHQSANQLLMVMLAGGNQRIKHPVKASDRRNNERIEAMVSNYTNYKALGEFGVYLRGLSYNLKRYEVEEEDAAMSDGEVEMQ